jgi:tetratricopeptide (TPR) repeat protein
VRLDDENPEFWHLLGHAHLKNDEPKIAIRCFREALKLNAYYNEIWSDLGRVIFNEDAVEKSIPLLEKAHKTMGDVSGINYLLAALYTYLDDDKAHKHFLLAINTERDLLEEFLDLFPTVMQKEIKKLLKEKQSK